MPLIGVEAGAATTLVWLTSAVIAAYLADRLGFAVAPFAVLAISLAAAASAGVSLRRRARPDTATLAAFVSVVAATFGWLMWRARPDFLPTGTGSDLAHHLALLAYIEQHRHLPHEAVLGAYLGEMIDYTPGLHLFAVMAGAWLRRDALHVLQAVVALTAALKIGLVLLIARRMMPDGAPRLAFALVAALMPWLPYVFFAGSFMEQSFLSQAMAELFAIGMWGAVVAWDAKPSAGAASLFALFGAATFLTWPVWVGPLTLTFVFVAASRAMSRRDRLRQVTIALLPMAIVAAIYASARKVYGFGMVNAVGFAIWPTLRTVGWPFAVLGVAGMAWLAIARRGRSAGVLLAAIALQGAALIVTGRRSGATAPYLSLKMTYFAIYPLSVAAALMMADVWRTRWQPSAAARYGWAPVALALLAAARSAASAPAAKPVVTQSVYLAGHWARARFAPECVDYLVADGYTAYWLHLAVFGNPRAAGRTLKDDTFDPKKATVRWILPGGLPYAIADDFDGLPRDIRTNVDVLARFGPAAVVQRRGRSACGTLP